MERAGGSSRLSMNPRPDLRAGRFIKFPIADTNQTIAQRFEQQVRRHPGRLAIKHNERTLTYAALNRAANRVAHAILARGGASENAPVALYCGAGLSTIVASLGALKAGKTFAPLDARLPQVRIKEIFANLESRLVITDGKNSRSARQLTGKSARTIDIDALDAGASTDDPRVAVSPDAVAYINFTSGTTGAPKGVMWNHRSELFGIRTKANALRIAASDRVSLLRANSVGAARDMFLALLNGAALLSLDLDERGLAALPSWLREEEISIFSCVATIFRHAVRGANGAANYPAVRLIHIGGEPVFKADVDLYKRCFSDRCIFVSRYSISETQAVSYFFIDKHTELAGERVPVGYPLEANEVLIRGADGKPLGPGAVGEIAVRSPYLSSGYWRQPELTRAKFLGAGTAGSARTYLTGDLGYRMADGCLVHVGRKDFQTKIRGHRVDVSAVETALHEIPSVKQAVVVTRNDATAGGRLIAYVVPRGPRHADGAKWRAHLQARLPRYMVPSSFVVLDSLPVNAGGKIDRRLLPEPSGRGLTAPMLAPQTALEKVLAGFWRDALAIPAPGMRDAFFELGGDSLKAARIIGRIQELFPLDQPPVILAEASTLEKLARFLLAHETAPGQSEKIAAVFLRVQSLAAAAVMRELKKYQGSANDG